MKEINFYKDVKFNVNDSIFEAVQGIVDEIIVYVSLMELKFAHSPGRLNNKIFHTFLIDSKESSNYSISLQIVCYSDKNLVSMSYDSRKRSISCGTNPIVLLNTVKDEIYKLN